MTIILDRPTANHNPDRQAPALRIIFLHHSTGRNLIRQGRIRDLIDQRNLRDGTSHEFWDHDYNRIGLTGPSGESVGASFDIPDDSTDPDGLARLFSQPLHDPPDNALSHLLAFDVVIFKSCFPASEIRSQAQLEEYKRHYLSIRSTLIQHPDKLFIVMTPPPLVPRTIMGNTLYSSLPSTSADDALRARVFSRWLTSEEFIMAAPNIKPFDLFDLLAEPSDSRRNPNTLRQQYRSGRLGQDSHPNHSANIDVAPIFVDALWKNINNFQRQAARHLVPAS